MTDYFSCNTLETKYPLNWFDRHSDVAAAFITERNLTSEEIGDRILIRCQLMQLVSFACLYYSYGNTLANPAMPFHGKHPDNSRILDNNVVKFPGIKTALQIFV